MIEIPRACVVADKIAEHADFFSFGTNDLMATRFLNFYVRSGGGSLLTKDLKADLTSQLAQELSNLIEEEKVQQVDTKIFDNSLFFAEEGIRSHLVRILEKGKKQSQDLETIQKHIASVEEELGIQYDSIQKQAICDAIQNKVFILTGGPGTGKTTVINGIIAVYALLEGLDLRKKSNLPILLAAPTGRAARRMNELTGLPSATIHRHLGMTGDDDTSHLEDYLDADFIIVDEFSMVDTWLANQLFSNISSNSKILIVGDSDQLPSVSPGQVLADLWTGQEEYDLLMHDWYLALLAAAFGHLVYIDRPSELYRQHSNNVLGARTFRKRMQNWIRPHILFAKYWKLIQDSQEQAKNLLALPLTTQNKEMIENFVTIMEVPLTERYKRLRKYGFQKNRAFHTFVFTTLILTKFAYKE